eukprot:scaffold34968_cov43-Phaeocystis_antarctica.AAC.3
MATSYVAYETPVCRLIRPGVACGGGEGAAMAWLAAARAVEATEATEAMGAVAGGWWEKVEFTAYFKAVAARVRHT